MFRPVLAFEVGFPWLLSPCMDMILFLFFAEPFVWFVVYAFVPLDEQLMVLRERGRNCGILGWRISPSTPTVQPTSP